MPKETLQAALGMAIRRRREIGNMSQDAMADFISMHRAYYSAIERGEKNLTLRILLRVADGLKARISDLIKEAGY
jgi:transcriptional regulator with XRE-family HTH domain